MAYADATHGAEADDDEDEQQNTKAILSAGKIQTQVEKDQTDNYWITNGERNKT